VYVGKNPIAEPAHFLILMIFLGGMLWISNGLTSFGICIMIAGDVGIRVMHIVGTFLTIKVEPKVLVRRVLLI
jgi:hypothetical protein